MSTELTLAEELRAVLNRHSSENNSNTPDWILADYLTACLDAFNEAVKKRASWYGRWDIPGQPAVTGWSPTDDSHICPTRQQSTF